MQCLVLAFVAFVAVAYAKPQLVEWFDMKPAFKHVQPVVKERLVKVSRPLDAYTEFFWFKKNHTKTYNDEKEERLRFEIFRENLKYIEEHNKKYDRGEKSYFLGVNQFADMKNYEFVMYNGFAKTNRTAVKECSKDLVPEFLVAPESVNWTAKGYVTPVKNQGQCGSCWSFSTTGSVEGQHFHATGKLVSLSEQQLVDCSGKFGNEGCNGGLMDSAFEYIVSAGGIESEDEYPYEAKQERKCHFHKSEVRATVTGCVDVESGSEENLKMAVAKVGPVSVAIDASHQSFQLYSGGVYDEPECSSTELDHGVLTVGYGTLEGQDYWLVKNSWGLTWGKYGYVMMSRNKENQCGIATQASYPLV